MGHEFTEERTAFSFNYFKILPELGIKIDYDLRVSRMFFNKKVDEKQKVNFFISTL
jgi:hypothetical protein